MLGLKAETRKVKVETPWGSFTTLQDNHGALICPVCGARFYSATDLVRHLAAHARGSPATRRDKE